MSDSTQVKNEEIKLTPEGLEAARRLQRENEQWQGLALRLYLDGKGCDGFFYGVTFDSPEKDDLHFPHGDIDLVVDTETFTFCKGSEIEWVDDERGKGFLVNNPHHQKYRGKFYKRKVWQDRLLEKQQNRSNNLG